MSDPRVDAARLAALLDGRLDAREREALLAELAASDDATEALGDVAAVLRDLEHDHRIPIQDLPAPDPRPPGGPHADPPPVADAVPAPAAPARDDAPDVRDIAGARVRRRVPWWGTLAAAVALAAVGLSLLRRPDDPATLVAALGPDARPVAGAPVWSATRGAGDALAPRARAVRFGALAATLQLAARARDTATASLAARTAALLDDASGGAAAARIYRAVAERPDAPADSLAALLRHGWDAAAPVLGADDAWLGAWLAAAREAAARRDAAYFRRSGTRRALAALTPGADAAAGGAVAQIGRAAAGAPDWGALADGLTALLASLGS